MCACVCVRVCMRVGMCVCTCMSEIIFFRVNREGNCISQVYIQSNEFFEFKFLGMN